MRANMESLFSSITSMQTKLADGFWSVVNSPSTLILGVAAVLLSLVIRYVRNRNYVEMRITRIFVHPIKSCRGTSVQFSEYTPQGLKYDRRLQLIDKKTHRMITARELPKLVLAHPQIELGGDLLYGGTLRIQFPQESGIDEVKTPLEPRPEVLENWTRFTDVQIWSHVTDAYIVQALPGSGSLDPSAAFSKYLDRDVLLVYKGPTPRVVGPLPTFPDLKSSANFQDGWPILVATEESLVDVQKKVDLSASGVTGWSIKGVQGTWSGELVMERFRPNVVLEGSGRPYAEEEWAEIDLSRGEEGTSAGSYGRMFLVSRCTRCMLPNIDPRTGIQHPAVPYKVLTKYRRVDPARPIYPCFGINAVPAENGTYRVGDVVRVARFAANGKLPDKVQQ